MKETIILITETITTLSLVIVLIFLLIERRKK